MSIYPFDYPQEIRNVSKSQECQKECLPDCQKTSFTFTGPYTDPRYDENLIYLIFGHINHYQIEEFDFVIGLPLNRECVLIWIRK